MMKTIASAWLLLASAVASASYHGLPDDAARETKQDVTNGHLVTVQGKQDAQTALQTTIRDNVGATNEAAAATDTSTSGLNGLVKRLLQRLTTLISFYAADYGASSGAIRVAAQPGNATGAADFNAGVTGAQTPRTSANLHGLVRETMPTPFTDGTSQHATMDHHGFVGVTDHSVMMTAWGRMFYGMSNYVSTGSTAESNLLLLRNPAGSGVVCGLHHINYGSPNSGEATYRLYQNPTVTGNGTTVAIAGGRSSGNQANTCILSTLPTTSARGTAFRAARTANQATDFADQFHFEYLIYPGTALLITAAQGLIGQPGNIDIHWGEIPQ